MKNIGDAIEEVAVDFATAPAIGEEGKNLTVFAIKNKDGGYLDDDGDFVEPGEYIQVDADRAEAQAELESVEDDHPEDELKVVELKIRVSVVEVPDVQTGGDLLNDAYGKVNGG